MAVMTTADVSSQRIDIPRPGRYRISQERSTVTIRTRHFFGLGAVRATLDLRDGRILVTEPPAASTVQARFSASSFESGSGARDAAVLSPRLLDAEAYPTLSFTSTELLQDQGSGRCAASSRCAASPGWSRPASPRCGRRRHDFRASARAGIDRYDFGITTYRGLAARRLTVDLDIVAHLEQS